MRAIQKQAIYVKVNENYTATVYSVEDLQAYCKRENIDPTTLTIEESYTVRETRFVRNEKLAKEVKKWMDSYKKPIVRKIYLVGS